MKKLLAVLLLSLILSPFNAYANKDEALASIQASVNELLAIVSNPDYADPAKKPALKEQAELSVMKTFDFEEFSTRTVGARWKTFTVDQKKRFTDAFTKLLRNTYIDRLDNYAGQTIEYTSVLEGNNGTRVEIRAMLTSNGQKFPFAFRMLKKNDKWVVYDVLIENISLIKNYREQFSSILTSDAPDDLIAKIEQKALELEQNTL